MSIGNVLTIVGAVLVTILAMYVLIKIILPLWFGILIIAGVGISCLNI